MGTQGLLFLKRRAAGLTGRNWRVIFGFGFACFIFLLGFYPAARSRMIGASPLPAESALRESFQNPPITARPMVRWWWPGGDVTDEEISRELRLMKEAGIGGVEIQSFKIGLDPHPDADVAARVNNFLSPEWFGHVKHAIEEGRRLGMIVDLTFGSGWPFGGPHIPPELGAKVLDVEVTPLQGPSHFQGQIPWVGPDVVPPPGIPSPFAHRDPNLFKLVAVVAVRGTPPVTEQVSPPAPSWRPPRTVVTRSGQVDSQSTVVLTAQVAPDHSLSWDVPPGDWLLFSFIQTPTGQQVTGGTGQGTQYVLDHLSQAALQKHIDAIGEAGKQYFGDEYGKGLRAIFCDSLEVRGFNSYWTDDFLAEFQKLRDYDLTPYLPLFKHPGYGDVYANYASLPLYDAPEIGDRIRHDYWQTVADVMTANFYQPLVDWAEKNHLQARIQAHGSPTNNLMVYGRADIPETEDLYASGDYGFLKLASSGAHLYGRPIVSSESFVWSNHDYDTTPEKIKRYADELLTAGINEIVYHGFAYEYMDRPDPGWYPFASRFDLNATYSSPLNFHNPFWEYLRPLNDYMARVQYVSQHSRFVAPVALYNHHDNYASGVFGDDYPLEYSLMAAGFNFDFINDDVLLHHAQVVKHQLLTPGSTYLALVFRNERRLPLGVVQKLHEFAQQGLPVVFLQAVPSEEIGFLHYAENGRQIRRLATEMFGGTSPEVVAATTDKKNGTTLFIKDDARLPALLESSLGVQPNLRFASPQPNIYFAEFDHGPIRFYFLRNPKGAPQDVSVVFPGAGTPEIWDPWTGQIAAAPHFAQMPNGTAMEIHLEPYGSTLVALGGAPAAVHVLSSNFAELREAHGRLTGTVEKPGTYLATLSDGKTVRANIAEGELPEARTLGPNWALTAVGRDKDGKEYTVEAYPAELKDWTALGGMRNFSGKGHYTLEFQLESRLLPPGLAWDLDLGEVHDVAEVWVNGRKAATLLLAPYRVDVTPYLQAGTNHLEIIVTNPLRNRLVGDGLGGDPNFVVLKNRLSYVPSGMLGPVRLEPKRVVDMSRRP